MQKIFVGIKVTGVLQEQIAAWRANFKHLPVRWIRDHDLHITIIPPWNEINVHGVLMRLRNALHGRRAFGVDLHKITLAPDPRKPRLIWAEGHPNNKLQSLKMALHRTVNHTDTRPLRPHVTISRFSRLEFRRMGVKKLFVPVRWHLWIDRIILFESPREAGKGYHIIEEFKLHDSHTIETRVSMPRHHLRDLLPLLHT